MSSQEVIRDSIERVVKAVEARPAVGRNTATTKVKLRDGLRCEVQDGQWKLTVDMSDKFGGENTSPNPGVYGRTALGSCLAVSYAMWAARLGIPLTSLDVEVQADYDVQGELGMDEKVRAGYTQMRYIVHIESDAPEEEVARMMEIAERCSAWLDDIKNPMDIRREVHISAPKSTVG